MVSFTIPECLPGYNELRGHWATAHRTKSYAMAVVGWAILSARIKPYARKVKVVIRCHDSTKRDDDNIMSGAAKIIMGALKNQRIIKDDGPAWATVDVKTPERVKANPRIEVEIGEA